MKNMIINKVENKFYTYIPGEFLPIFEDGQLANRQAFYAYKLRRAGRRIHARLV